MPIHHVGISAPTDKHQEVVSWYLAALGPLGYTKILSAGPNDIAVGLGVFPNPDFWIIALEPGSPGWSSGHRAFTAKDKETVDAFHAAAVKAGGTCNGPPGLRPEYHPKYYGAFVKDPCGNNIEAVFFDDSSD